MKSYRKELWFETPGRRAFLNITSQVEAALKESGVQEGLALVNAMHITASVFINDDERGLHADYDAWLGLPPYARRQVSDEGAAELRGNSIRSRCVDHLSRRNNCAEAPRFRALEARID